MPACVAQQKRAACDDKANHAFQGQRGLYISASLCSCSELSATTLGTCDNKACCHLFNSARVFQLCHSEAEVRWHKIGLCMLKQHVQLSGVQY
jgi:hypothetical protein